MKQNTKNEELSQDFLKKIIHYDSLTGIFKLLERPVIMFSHCKNPHRQCNTWNTRYANKEAGTIWTIKKIKTSYIIINISSNGKTKRYRAHRLAFLYTDGHFPPEAVDHIDGNGLNNRWINLREVSNQENMKNQSMQCNNTSGCVGVTWYKRDQKWRVFINVNRKPIHGGYFHDKNEAIAKRKEMEIEYGFHKNHGRLIKRKNNE